MLMLMLMPMTKDEFAAWRKAMGWSVMRAAKELGYDRRQIQRWEHGVTRLPPALGLACAALAVGLRPWTRRKGQR